MDQQEGYPLFLEHGGNNPYLEHIASILKIIHQGMAIQDMMFTMFSELGLVESIKIDVYLNNGEKHRLVGNHTINEDNLAALSDDQLGKLSKLGFTIGLCCNHFYDEYPKTDRNQKQQEPIMSQQL